MTIVGIDPGKSGGMAFLCNGNVGAFKLNETERDIDTQLNACLPLDGPPAFAFIERVHSSPQMGVKSAFSFGQSYGFLRGLLIAQGIPFETITPAKWQRAMGCLSKGDKNVTKARAQELFPAIKVTHAIADALLIAEYGRRLRSGEL